MRTCQHVSQITSVTHGGNGCEDCLKIGGRWVHLRMCMSCGHVACCDSSPNQHATKHYNLSEHPIIRSVEPGEEWGFCYPDDIFFETILQADPTD